MALAALLVLSPARAQQKLLPAQSEISFVSRQMGSPVEGRFRSFDAQVALDPKQLAAAKIVLVVDLASATLASTDTETELRQSDWFDVKKFPQASFTSSAVKSVGPGRIEVVGSFSLKGRSRPHPVPGALTQAGGITTATGTFTASLEITNFSPSTRALAACHTLSAPATSNPLAPPPSFNTNPPSTCSNSTTTSAPRTSCFTINGPLLAPPFPYTFASAHRAKRCPTVCLSLG